MPFSMSGNNPLGYSYNRFDKFEAEYSKEEETKQEEETLEEGSCGTKGYQEGGEVKCDKCEGKGCKACGKKSKKTSGARPDYLDLDKDGDKEEDMKDAADSAEGMSEGIDFKGAAREQARRDKIQAEKDKKSPSSKDYRLMKGKFRPGASAEEFRSGSRDVMREKGTQPIKDGKPMFNKEELEATGLFTAEEIEALLESNCGDRAYPKGMQKGGRVGYQKGGEVKCDKCEGKGCDHCDEKGSHKKEEVKEAAKPDFLDMDGDGDKKEPMKKAIKEKGGKKKDAVVEAAVAALAPLLGKAAAGAKVAAKGAAVDAAMDLGGKGVRAVTSLPGKVMSSAADTVKDAEADSAE